MQYALLVSRGIDISRASPKQVSNLRACVEQLAKDPRVTTIYGVTNQSTGWAAWCEVSDRQEVERLAAMAELCGQTEVEIIQLTPSERLRAGLEEIEKASGVVPQAFSHAFPSSSPNQE